MPDNFNSYINLVEHNNLAESLRNSIKDLWLLDLDKLTKLHSETYAPGKWTVNDIIQHLTDTERIFCAGTLRFARNEADHIISFNQETLALNAQADDKPVEQLIEELIIARKATFSLFSSFTSIDFEKTGTNQQYKISVAAMGYTIVGHQLHHLNIIKEKYYPIV